MQLVHFLPWLALQEVATTYFVCVTTFNPMLELVTFCLWEWYYRWFGVAFHYFFQSLLLSNPCIVYVHLSGMLGCLWIFQEACDQQMQSGYQFQIQECDPDQDLYLYLYLRNLSCSSILPSCVANTFVLDIVRNQAPLYHYKLKWPWPFWGVKMSQESEMYLVVSCLFWSKYFDVVLKHFSMDILITILSKDFLKQNNCYVYWLLLETASSSFWYAFRHLQTEWSQQILLCAKWPSDPKSRSPSGISW